MKILLAESNASPDQLLRKIPDGARWCYAGENILNYDRFKGKLDGTCKLLWTQKEFNDFVNGMRAGFVKWIDEATAEIEKNYFYWTDLTYHKNPQVNGLFAQVCYLSFIINSLKKEKQSLLVISENQLLLHSIEANLTKSGIKIEWANSHNRTLCLMKIFLRGIKIFLYNFVLFLYRLLIVKFVYPNSLKPEDTDGPLVIVGTFVLPSEFSKDGRFNNRSFLGLFEWFKKKGYRCVVFPKFAGDTFKNTANLISNARKCRSHKFLLTEDMVSLRDILYAFFYPFKKLMFKTRQRKYEGLDIEFLLKKEWWRNIFSIDIPKAVMDYRFPARLKEKRIKPTIFISWYENQTVDKGRVAGFHKYLPEVRQVGGQIFIPMSNYLSLYVTDQEAKMGTIPDKLLVPGKALIKPFSEFAGSVPVVDAASMRYAYLWRFLDEFNRTKKHLKNNGIRKVFLVTFPESISESIALLVVAMPSIKKLGASGIEILFKTHPSMPDDVLLIQAEQAGLKLNKDNFVNTHLSGLFSKVGLVLSCSSSSAIEAVCCGIKVLMFSPPVGVESIPVFPASAKNFWKKVYTEKDVNRYVSDWLEDVKKNKPETINREILADTFNPMNDEYMEPFISDRTDNKGIKT